MQLPKIGDQVTAIRVEQSRTRFVARLDGPINRYGGAVVVGPTGEREYAWIEGAKKKPAPIFAKPIAAKRSSANDRRHADARRATKHTKRPNYTRELPAFITRDQ